MVLVDTRIPPGKRELHAELAERLIGAAWYSNPGQRFGSLVVVIDIDIDSTDPDPLLLSFESELRSRLQRCAADIRCMFALMAIR